MAPSRKLCDMIIIFLLSKQLPIETITNMKIDIFIDHLLILSQDRPSMKIGNLILFVISFIMIFIGEQFNNPDDCKLRYGNAPKFLVWAGGIILFTTLLNLLIHLKILCLNKTIMCTITCIYAIVLISIIIWGTISILGELCKKIFPGAEIFKTPMTYYYEEASWIV